MPWDLKNGDDPVDIDVALCQRNIQIFNPCSREYFSNHTG